MSRVMIHIPPKLYRAMRAHLLPSRLRNEEAGFMYVRPTSAQDGNDFEFVDWDPIPPNGFLVRSRYYFELTDESRAMAIKHAHDLGASLVEMHSHAGSLQAAFSPSDLIGFDEFVPHVMWRLQGKPYFAVVVARNGFDGLAWLDGPNNPQRLDGIVVGEKTYVPTQLSPLRNNAYGQ